MIRNGIFRVFVLSAALLVAGGVSYAQTANTEYNTDAEVALLRKDVRSAKKQMIAQNLTLTEAEAIKFWPVYDQYAAEMAKQYDELYALIKDYIANEKTLSDAQAVKMLMRLNEIQAGMIKVRQKYVPMVAGVIPGKKAAFFFQIDRRLYMLVDLQLASEIPLVVL